MATILGSPALPLTRTPAAERSARRRAHVERRGREDVAVDELDQVVVRRSLAPLDLVVERVEREGVRVVHRTGPPVHPGSEEVPPDGSLRDGTIGGRLHGAR